MITSQDGIIQKSYHICERYFEQRRQTYDPTCRESIECHWKSVGALIQRNLLLGERLPFETLWRKVTDAPLYCVQGGAFLLENSVKIPFHLYVPKANEQKMPAVIMPVGHYDAGKRTPEYMIMAQTLASSGCICLLYDPVGQGERDAQPDKKLINELKDLYTVYRHMEMGDQLYEAGQQLAAWFVEESRIAVDYLLSRQDVDQKRIGAIGQSGGGTNVQYLCAVEPRLSLAIPIHCTSTYAHLLQQTVGDCEQSFVGEVENGVEMSDFYLPWAGKALCIISGREDFFNPDGAKQVYEEIRTARETLGADTSKLRFELCDGGHVISPEVRGKVYRFVQQVFGLETGEENIELLEKPMCLTSEERQDTQEAFREEMVRRTAKVARQQAELWDDIEKNESGRLRSCCNEVVVDKTGITVSGENAAETLRLTWEKKTGRTLWLLGDTEQQPPQDAAVARISSDGIETYRSHKRGYSQDAIHFYLSVLTGTPLWLQRTAQLKELLERVGTKYEHIVLCSNGFFYQPVQMLRSEFTGRLNLEHVQQSEVKRPSDLLCRLAE